MSVPLPPAEIRQGGPALTDDTQFVETGQHIVDLLEAAGLKPGMRLVDFGCGPGRLAVALIQKGWDGDYIGVDVKADHIAWCTSHITSRWPSYRFIKSDAANRRYNPQGTPDRRIPVDTADMVCAWSVFSHMLGDETLAWLKEIRHILTPIGVAFVTAFVEDDVPPETENPAWYGAWKGPLHCVLYSTTRIEQLIGEAGLKLVKMVDTGHRQTGLVMRPR